MIHKAIYIILTIASLYHVQSRDLQGLRPNLRPVPIPACSLGASKWKMVFLMGRQMKDDISNGAGQLLRGAFSSVLGQQKRNEFSNSRTWLEKNEDK